MDTHSWILWLGIIAVGLHVLEEYAEGWVAWANQDLGPRYGITFADADFFLANGLLVFFALAGAAIGWWGPAVSLAVPALFIAKAVFLHMLPSARGDRLVPGTLSAVFILLPVAAWMYWAAAEDGVLDFGTVLLSFALGAALTAYPIAVMVLRSKIGWQEEHAAPVAAGELTAEGPTMEVDETEVDEPLTEEPILVGPVSDEAMADEPTTDEQFLEEPAADEPSNDEAFDDDEDETVIEVEGEIIEPETILMDEEPEGDTEILDRDSERDRPAD